jgi:hypothetical protein
VTKFRIDRSIQLCRHLFSRRRQFRGFLEEIGPRLVFGLLQPLDRAAAIQRQRQFFAHAQAQRGKIVHPDRVFAGDRAQREQALLDTFKPALVGVDRGTRRLDLADRLGGLQQGALHGGHRRIQRSAGLVGHARQVTLRRAQGIFDIVCTREFSRRRIQRLEQLFGMHQARALLSQLFLFAGPRVQLRQFSRRMFQKFPVALGLFRGFGGLLRSLGRLAPDPVSLANRGRRATQPAITV